MGRASGSWPQAAAELARRIHRRERLGAALGPLGRGLLAGGVAGTALKLAGVAFPWPGLALGAPALLGLLAALGAVGRVRPVQASDAAWALDRVAGAEERGLAAATVPGPVGAEAAWATGRVDPPRVGLLPPLGLALLLGGVLAVVLALLVPAAPGDGSAGPVAALGDGSGGGPAGAPAEGEQAALADEARAEAAAAVREALGLGPQAATDPERIAERLADERTREAAADAAPEGSDLAALLARGASPDLLAEALADGGQAEARAREARRRSAVARAGGAFLTVPPDRRALLERYTSRRDARVPSGNGER